MVRDEREREGGRERGRKGGREKERKKGRGRKGEEGAVNMIDISAIPSSLLAVQLVNSLD